MVRRANTALRQIRMARGKSTLQVADEMTELGCPVRDSTIRRWESGHNLPSPRSIPALAAVLKIDTAELVRLLMDEREKVAHG